MVLLHTNREISQVCLRPFTGLPRIWVVFDDTKIAEIDDKYAEWFVDIPGFWLEEDEPVVILDYEEVDLI